MEPDFRVTKAILTCRRTIYYDTVRSGKFSNYDMIKKNKSYNNKTWRSKTSQNQKENKST